MLPESITWITSQAYHGGHRRACPVLYALIRCLMATPIALSLHACWQTRLNARWFRSYSLPLAAWSAPNRSILKGSGRWKFYRVMEELLSQDERAEQPSQTYVVDRLGARCHRVRIYQRIVDCLQPSAPSTRKILKHASRFTGHGVQSMQSGRCWRRRQIGWNGVMHEGCCPF